MPLASAPARISPISSAISENASGGTPEGMGLTHTRRPAGVRGSYPLGIRYWICSVLVSLAGGGAAKPGKKRAAS